MHLNGKNHKAKAVQAGQQQIIQTHVMQQSAAPVYYNYTPTTPNPPAPKPKEVTQPPPPGVSLQAALVKTKLTSDPAKKDLSQFRTPSGQFYCPTCNVSLNSENQFLQHLESKKHRSKGVGPAHDKTKKKKKKKKF